jgi:hypothetical protein
MNTAFTMNPAPMVRTLTVSLRMAARTKKVTIAAQMNRTRSTGGILSVTPAMTARNVGINAACRRTNPIHPIDSAVLGTSLLSRKYLMPSLIFPNLSIQLTFVEDVFSNLGDSSFLPFGVDIVCMIE